MCTAFSAVLPEKSSGITHVNVFIWKKGTLVVVTLLEQQFSVHYIYNAPTYII